MKVIEIHSDTIVIKKDDERHFNEWAVTVVTADREIVRGHFAEIEDARTFADTIK